MERRREELLLELGSLLSKAQGLKLRLNGIKNCLLLFAMEDRRGEDRLDKEREENGRWRAEERKK